MIIKYFSNYYTRIKETKKVARDKNNAVWVIPIFDSILVSIFLSWQLSIGIWIVFDTWQNTQVYPPWYMDMLWQVSSFSFTIFLSIIMLTILDKMILFFIHIHFLVNKLVLRGISKLDMYLWKKTGRDSVITNAIWKMQTKFMSKSKNQRRLMTVAFVGLIVTYYGWLIAT